MRPILICAACLSFVILGGCRSEAPENAGSEQMPTAEVLEQTVASDEVEVSVASWEEIQAWVAMQKGKVVVIDLWSTMCLPCMKEFPNFVEFSRAYEGKVVCASVSVDFIGGPDGIPPDVLKTCGTSISFGRFTYPHQLFKVMLLEQIYRATTIMAKHPYHKE